MLEPLYPELTEFSLLCSCAS